MNPNTQHTPGWKFKPTTKPTEQWRILNSHGDATICQGWQNSEGETIMAALAEVKRLREATEKLARWFKNPLLSAFSTTEHLLAGCPNELAVDVERARAALEGRADA